MSIRLRLTAWYSGILAVTLLLFSAIIYVFVYYNTYENTYETWKSRISDQINKSITAANVSADGTVNPTIDVNNILQTVDRRLYVQIYYYDTQKLQQSDNMTFGDNAIKFDVPDPKNVKQEFSRIRSDGRPYLIYQRVMVVTNRNSPVLLQIAASTEEAENMLSDLRFILGLGSVSTLILAFTLGLFLARKSMAPIGKVIEAANAVQTSSDLSMRIDYTGPEDEIGRLISTVNRMMARTELFYKDLEESYRTQRRFVSDASHELRTPLTTIRGNIDLLKKVWSPDGSRSALSEEDLREMSIEAVGDIADEAERMSRLVADMLSLARADAGQTMQKELLQIKPLVEEVVRRSQFLPHRAEWAPGDLDALDGIAVVGSKDYLQQMLFIFIENAFKYTMEGQVTLDVVVYRQQVGIRVSDTGIGMDKDEVPHIFERFYRADESRGKTPGTGLGLSIAKWIIDEHQGSVEVVTVKGEGTTFIIWLPALFPEISAEGAREVFEVFEAEEPAERSEPPETTEESDGDKRD
ncbi:HAMP domain-containing sensor histidine kinase [Saccharibacillus sp. CPCC 101409]|uniref:sensor histidine kinase n=1 Tax=Saccharibacillus sp. CPCC 101409 TaxID=3058041 RepID=UPI00267228B8|nr:HAMP domain-containing sensor histidine kinase [Saccharibacillus sp. CPCC 101409]MDO3408799.1 HAMP domain-containing sensor histidine kinase [Saccharibacillus sp. CPCC 101409]